MEKNIWYVGDSMFHTAQWSSAHSKSTPPLKAIRIWAHLTGVPLDLRHDEGLSLVAGLVGEPKETLPPVVEFERESGEVVEVSVHYPWVPPTCSHCKELGHVVRNCLLFSPPTRDPPKNPPTVPSKNNSAHQTNPLPKPAPSHLSTPSKDQSKASPRPTNHKTSLKSKIYKPITPTNPSHTASSSLGGPELPITPAPTPTVSSRSSPDPPPRPSLK